jgi:serine/threonine-protein kinase SRPK3
MADFLLPMLRLVPEERATAAEMLRHPWLADAGGMAREAVPLPQQGQSGGGAVPPRRQDQGGGARGGHSSCSRSRSRERGSGGGGSRSGSGGEERDSRSPRRRAHSEPAAKRSR